MEATELLCPLFHAVFVALLSSSLSDYKPVIGYIYVCIYIYNCMLHILYICYIPLFDLCMYNLVTLSGAV